jgi:hypothetical protein
MSEYTEMLLTEVDYESKPSSPGLGYGTIWGSCKHRNESSGSKKALDELNHEWRLNKDFN